MLPERAGPVAGVVLAAGASARMGRNKLLLDLGGESVVRRSVRCVLEAGLDPVLVVLGHEADRVRAELAGLPCVPVVNLAHARGMNTSLGAGIAAVPSGAIAAVVALPDMPLVTPAMVAELVRRYRGGTAPLVVSRYGETLAPPMLYDRALFGELTGLEGDGCGKRAARRHRAEAVVLPWPEAALADLDEEADYERVRAELRRG